MRIMHARERFSGGQRVVWRVWFWSTTWRHANAPPPPCLTALPPGGQSRLVGQVTSGMQQKDAASHGPGPGLSHTVQRELSAEWGLDSRELEALIVYCFAQHAMQMPEWEGPP